jgi:hypothetical protein
MDNVPQINNCINISSSEAFVSYLVKTFSAFYWTRRFSTVSCLIVAQKLWTEHLDTQATKNLFFLLPKTNLLITSKQYCICYHSQLGTDRTIAVRFPVGVVLF